MHVACLVHGSVVVHKPHDALVIFSTYFIGKGSLSRSKPFFMGRELDVKEVLYLTFEEAFFLMCHEGCLSILDACSQACSECISTLSWTDSTDSPRLSSCESPTCGVPLSEDQCLSRFCGVRPLFPMQYAVYLRYRLLGWLPRPGHKYGCHLVLYRQAPHTVHSEFTVLIVDGKDARPLSAQQVQLHVRTSENTKKKLLLCYVAEAARTQDGCTTYDFRDVLVERWKVESAALPATSTCRNAP
mmetsp:Transcript_27919/g.70028  ORF Transcript_27919/g.70028 Transcript_27919/m.70028 type:complete len:243 (+) Transcript_27919:163-891(+)